MLCELQSGEGEVCIYLEIRGEAPQFMQTWSALGLHMEPNYKQNTAQEGFLSTAICRQLVAPLQQ